MRQGWNCRNDVGAKKTNAKGIRMNTQGPEHLPLVLANTGDVGLRLRYSEGVVVWWGEKRLFWGFCPGFCWKKIRHGNTS